MTFAKRMRMIWIDAVIDQSLTLRRADLCQAFNISVPQASADIRDFITKYPSRMRYDRSGKCYRPGDPAPAFDRALHRPIILAQTAVQTTEAA